VVLATVVLQAEAAGGAQTLACGPVGAHTLARDAQARVYVTSAGVYGCAHHAAAPVRLGASVTSCLGGDRIGPVALAGTTVAYASERCAVDTGLTRVLIRRLADGRLLGRAGAGTATSPESYTAVTSLVVRASGSAAWIAFSSSLGAKESLFEVWRLVRGSRRRLDSDLNGGIETRSLRLRGRRITWRDGGRTRSATLG
jgi:hypothetical protein